MNAAEDRLSELMSAATCALDPPIDAILAAGERLGRARRRRRRATLAAGSAAVVLLAGAGVAAGIHDPDLVGDYDVASHATHSARPIPVQRAPAAVSTSSPVAETPAAQPTGDLTPIDAQAAVVILRKLVAASWYFGSYPPASPGSVLLVDVDDGQGRAQIFVNVAPSAKSGMDPVDCVLQQARLKAQAQAKSYTTSSPNGYLASCNVVALPNGDTAMEEVITPPHTRIVMDRVVVNRSDGLSVEITAQNGAPGSNGTVVTRPLPPLNPAVWAIVASSRLWQLEVPVAEAK